MKIMENSVRLTIKSVFISWVLLFSISESIDAQGVSWQQWSSWSSIKEKAQKENKYIFVDAYTSWCAPCRKMDIDVYGSQQVGNALNSVFLSVKIQMDLSPNADEKMKDQFGEALQFQREYQVEGFPTFLFFTPDGKLVHKASGYHDINSFLLVCEQAIDSNRLSYYSMLECYKKGERNYLTMIELINKTRDLLGDMELAKEMAQDYKVNYLDKLSPKEICRKEILDFITLYASYVNSNDNLFKIVYNNPNKADSVVGTKGWSNQIVRIVIKKEELLGKIYRDKKYRVPVTIEPNWDSLASEIAHKFDKKYVNIIYSVKIAFYRSTKNWHKFADAREEKTRAFPLDRYAGIFDDNSPFLLNADAWDVFLNCNDKEVLKRALIWINQVIAIDQPKPNIQYMDTKANLLYKLKDIKNAIALEQIAFNITTEGGKRTGDQVFMDIIKKMKSGEPTWNVTVGP